MRTDKQMVSPRCSHPKITITLGVITALALLLVSTPASAFEPIPTSEEESSVAPMYVTYMTMGAPADSVVLRVSLCNSGGTRCGPNSFLIIEELRWPSPDPKITVEHTAEVIKMTYEDIESEWLLRSTRISGEYLNGIRRKLPPLPNQKNPSGELGSHFLRPFKFSGWRSPREFVVEEDRARYVIRWHGSGQFELVEASRLQ